MTTPVRLRQTRLSFVLAIDRFELLLDQFEIRN